MHGLIRGHDLELGRDADTGGQTKYVVEVARALAALPGVARVDLLTRRVVDPTVADDYGQPEEDLGGCGRIVRLDAGPDGYIPKEQLWDYLDTFVDNALTYLRQQPRQPDIVHRHYADAGYGGSRLAGLLGIPLVHTGHSLGRVRRRCLLAGGLTAEQVETRFNMMRRIEAEETTLVSAELVITSTHQEIEEQYGLYDHPPTRCGRRKRPRYSLSRFPVSPSAIVRSWCFSHPSGLICPKGNSAKGFSIKGARLNWPGDLFWANVVAVSRQTTATSIEIRGVISIWIFGAFKRSVSAKAIFAGKLPLHLCPGAA